MRRWAEVRGPVLNPGLRITRATNDWWPFAGEVRGYTFWDMKRLPVSS